MTRAAVIVAERSMRLQTLQQYVAFLVPFFITAILVGFGLPALALTTLIGAAYAGYEPNSIVPFWPLFLAPVIAGFAWAIRKRWPLSYAAQGLFHGCIAGLTIVVAMVLVTMFDGR